MLRLITSVVLGTILGMIIMIILHYLSAFAYPLPEGVNMSDAEKFAEYLESAPNGAFILAMISHLLGAFFASIFTIKLLRSKEWEKNNFNLIYPIIIGIIFTISGYMNLQEIPHPNWFFYELFLYIPSSLLGYQLIAKKN